MKVLARMRVVLGLAFRANPRLAVGSIGLCIVSSVAGPVSALFLRNFVDAAAAGDGSAATTAAVALAVTWVGANACDYFSAHSSFALHTHMMRLVITELIDISGRVPTIELHERPDVADRVELLRGDVKALAFAMTSLMWTIGIVTRLVSTVLVLASVAPLLVLLPLMGVPSLVIGARVQRQRLRAREETIEAERLSDHLLELGTTPGPGKEVRVFGLAREIARRHAEQRRIVADRERRVETRGTLAIAVGWFLFAVGYAAAIVYVTLLAIDGRATVGDVLLVIDLSAQIRFQFAGSVALIGQFQRNLRAADHYLWLRDYVDREVAARPGAAPVPAKLTEGVRFEGVGFRYPGTDVDVLDDVDLEIPTGTALAIVGLNGAGKTTLVKLLAGLYEPTRGRITVDGMDLREVDLDAWRAHLSACFQDFVHFEYVARESVGLGEPARIEQDAEVRAALERASAVDVLEPLSDGLGTLLGQGYGDGIELSTGQWQKVALGRAMMREEPLVLILDEPTASLDAYTEHAIFERYAHAVRRAGHEGGAITVLISHRFSTVRMADLVVVLEGGRIVQRGTHDELEAEPGAYRELYRLHSRGYR
jgi:ATP-binding cassette subfamily B protein